MNRGQAAPEFKIASEELELEAIHGLNYRTFAEEIPQHASNPERRLVDRFHAENTYAICLCDGRLVGMVAGRGIRPFSLDGKLPDLDSYLPPGRKVLEVRLLSVEREYRNGVVFSRLVGLLAQHFKDQGYDLAIISGTTRQQRLYRHLGFVPFGPAVGTDDARFQPMYLTLERFLQGARALSPPTDSARPAPASYLPGPVDVHEHVRRAFGRPPVSHRSDGFMADFRATRRMLCDLTGARHAEILLGSGSLANDVVCAQLSLLGEPGLVLSNGEFGERLIDHAVRQGLPHEVCRADWGEPFDHAEIDRCLERNPALRWLWAVHCETSTGVLNDLGTLERLCAGRDVKLALDAISSIGTVPVDLGGVYLASCASGKALASYAGLSIVFYDHEAVPAPGSLPRYLDLGFIAAQAGIPFTHSSNLVYALQAALMRSDRTERFREVAEAAARLRAGLREAGLAIVAPDGHASPAVVTLALPGEVSSHRLGEQLRAAGCLLSCNSGYLLQRNWIQVCLMGEWNRERVAELPALIAECCRRQCESPSRAGVAEAAGTGSYGRASSP